MRLGAVLLLAGCRCAEPARQGPPNVLVLSMDTVAATRLTGFGGGPDTAPFLDRFACRGTRFLRAVAQAPSTEPTHASLMTGRFVSEHGLFSFRHRLLEQETLARRVTGAGYATFAAVSSTKFAPETGVLQGFETVLSFEDLPKNDRTASVFGAFLDWSADHREGPWLAFLHTYDAHAPYNAPGEPWRRFHEGPPGPVEPLWTAHYIQEHKEEPDAVDAARRAWLEALYAGNLRHHDDLLRSGLEALEDAGALQNTIVVVLSDHGEAFFEHGYLGHSKVLWQEVAWVPLAILGPGVRGDCAQTMVPAQTVDIAPTVLDLLGLPTDGMSGRSLRPWLEADAEPTTVPLVLQSPERWALARKVDGEWLKLTVDAANGAPLHLDGLDRDWRGSEDLRDERPEATEALEAELVSMGLDDPQRASTPRGPLPADEVEKLRAMGYVE